MDSHFLLSVRDLHKRFVLHAVDGRVVEGLRGVDLDLVEGEHLALAGTSGAGKSSMLKCIHRTYAIDSGALRYRSADGTEYDLATLPDAEMAELRSREIGYVSQFLRAEPRRGVFDVVVRSAVRRGMPEGEAADRAAEVLRRMHIHETLWQTYPTLLSGGEKQRVNLAAGIVAAPRLLLLDEPVASLDPENRDAVLSVIEDVPAETGATVLSVFHDWDAIVRCADRVVVLSHGKNIDAGSAEDVAQRIREPELV